MGDKYFKELLHLLDKLVDEQKKTNKGIEEISKTLKSLLELEKEKAGYEN